MPSLPCPLPFFPSGGDLPVKSTEDVLAAYPEDVRRVATAPVRDAIVAAQKAMFLAFQWFAAYAAIQSDPTRATGDFLDEFTSEVGIHRQDGEETEALRGRYYASQQVVTPNAIKAVVDAILAQVTTVRCQLYESVLDRFYLSDGTAIWHSFVGDGTVEVGPDYPDRYYEQRGQASPGGAILFRERHGCHLILRLPNLANTADQGMFVFGEGTPDDYADRAFVFDGTDPDFASYVFAGAHAAAAIYAAIVNSLEVIRGHGIRVTISVEDKMVA